MEGTPEEVDQVLRALPQISGLRTAAVELTDEVDPSLRGLDSSVSESSEVVTTRFARRVLTRLGLSVPMTKVLTALYEASPGSVPMTTLHEIAEYAPSQFAGLMGAFGRRIANTEGYEPDRKFFYYKWNEAAGTWDYRLPETVCEALKIEQLV